MGQDYGWPAWGPAIIAGAITIKCGPPRPPLTYAPSAKGPQTADHFLQEKILISLQTGGWPEHREACDRFFCKRGVCCRRANSKIKGGGCAMAAWECSAGVTGQHYHPNCTVGLLQRERGMPYRGKVLYCYMGICHAKSPPF